MVKTVTILKEDKFLLSLPKEFVGKQIEIIAFATEEVSNSLQSKNTLTHFASEKVLSKYWLNEDEDKAWENL